MVVDFSPLLLLLLLQWLIDWQQQQPFFKVPCYRCCQSRVTHTKRNFNFPSPHFSALHLDVLHKFRQSLAQQSLLLHWQFLFINCFYRLWQHWANFFCVHWANIIIIVVEDCCCCCCSRPKCQSVMFRCLFPPSTSFLCCCWTFTAGAPQQQSPFSLNNSFLIYPRLFSPPILF